MEKAKLAVRYISHWLNAVNGHSLHSPFLYDFYSHVIKEKRQEAIFLDIERERKQLLKDESEINILDLGAGSKVSAKNTRKVKSVAKSALGSPKFSQLLFNIIRHSKAKTILELGTSFGINTAYMASANPHSNIYTFEGCPDTISVARNVFNNLKINNIDLIEGDINTSFSNKIDALDQLDLVYFDANHQKISTLAYFEKALTKSHDQSIFIFDDIHWSGEMQEVWKEIITHDAVTLSLDLFDAGIVFFDKSLKKEHYILAF